MKSPSSPLGGPNIHRATLPPAALRAQGLGRAAAADALTLLGLGRAFLGFYDGFYNFYSDFMVI